MNKLAEWVINQLYSDGLQSTEDRIESFLERVAIKIDSGISEPIAKEQAYNEIINR